MPYNKRKIIINVRSVQTKKTFLFSPVPGTSHGIFCGFFTGCGSEAEPSRSENDLNVAQITWADGWIDG